MCLNRIPNALLHYNSKEKISRQQLKNHLLTKFHGDGKKSQDLILKRMMIMIMIMVTVTTVIIKVDRKNVV